MELGIADTAADIEGDDDAGLVMMELTPQIQAVWLTPVQPGRRAAGTAK